MLENFAESVDMYSGKLDEVVAANEGKNICLCFDVHVHVAYIALHILLVPVMTVCNTYLSNNWIIPVALNYFSTTISQNVTIIAGILIMSC